MELNNHITETAQPLRITRKRKKPASAALVVAAKRRLAGSKSIPEDVKFSIQLMLICYHTQNPLPVNCVPAEYESVFHEKLHLYGFPDAESMLRSPEMKSSVIIFNNNKIPSIRGLPLPRSTNMMRMRGTSWVIYPFGVPPLDVSEEIDESPLRISMNDLLHPLKEDKVSSDSDQKLPIRCVSSSTNSQWRGDQNTTCGSPTGQMKPLLQEQKAAGETEGVSISRVPSDQNVEITSTVFDNIRSAPESQSSQDSRPVPLTAPGGNDDILKTTALESPRTDSDNSPQKDKSLNDDTFPRKPNVPQIWPTTLAEEDKNTSSKIQTNGPADPKISTAAGTFLVPTIFLPKHFMKPMPTALSPPNLQPESEMEHNNGISAYNNWSQIQTTFQADKSILKSTNKIANPSFLTPDILRKLQSRMNPELQRQINLQPKVSDLNTSVLATNPGLPLTAQPEAGPETTLDPRKRAKSRWDSHPNDKQPEVVLDSVQIQSTPKPKPSTSPTVASIPLTKTPIQVPSSKLTQQPPTPQLENIVNCPAPLKPQDQDVHSSDSNQKKSTNSPKSPKASSTPKKAAPVPTINIEDEIQIVKESFKVHPQIIVGKMKPAGGIRNFHKHAGEHEKKSSDPDAQPTGPDPDFTNLKLKQLIQGRSLMKLNKLGQYCSSSSWSPIYIDAETMKKFEAFMKGLKANGLATLERLQNALMKSQKCQHPVGSCFTFYSALKLAEVDFLHDWQLSNPRTPEGVSIVKPDEILYFCDLAGGPGGNVEYMLWRTKAAAKGWGLTRHDNRREYSYRVQNSPVVCPEYFEAYYGDGKSKDAAEVGSFLDRPTVEGFIDLVLKGTGYKGVHVVTTLGSFNSLGNSTDNEKVWKPILLVQLYIALKVLREGGNFVLKMFDCKTNYSASLLYFLMESFDNISCRKPFTTVPGSSERAFVCTGRKSPGVLKDLLEYLDDCHKQMCKWKASSDRFEKHKKFDKLLPDEYIISCPRFLRTLKKLNTDWKGIQMEELKEILACGPSYNSTALDNLVGARNVLLEGQMYNNWKLERHDFSREAMRQEKDENVLAKSIGYNNPGDLNLQNMTLTLDEVLTFLHPAQKFRFVPIGEISSALGVFIGVGGRHIYRFRENGKLEDIRKSDVGAKFLLAKGTVVLGEIAQVEYEQDDASFESKSVFYIIDGMMLGGRDIRNLPYCERITECKKYAMAVTQFYKPKYAEVKVRESYCLDKIAKFLRALKEPSKKSDADGYKLQIRIPNPPPPNCSEKKAMTGVKGVLLFDTSPTTSGTPPDFLTTIVKSVIWKWSEAELNGRLYSDNPIMMKLKKRGISVLK